MKALVLHAVRDLRVDEWPEPEAGPGQVKVRVRAVGVCGSDVHYYTHGRIGDQVVREPMIVGHEGAGEIVDLGDGVTGLKVGQRVTLEPAHSCGQCEWCRTGKPNVCPNVKFCSTPPNNGLMCEFAVLSAEQCIPIPDALSFEEAAMLEPLQVSVHAANLVGVVPGETAAVVGAGCIGLGCMEMARAGGASRIIVTDKLGYRLDLARDLGADETVNVSEEDPADAVLRLTDGRGANLVFECTNKAAGAPQAYDLAGIGGRVCLVGIPEEDEICVDSHRPRRKELRVQYVRRSRHAAHQAITLVANGQVDVARWVTHRVGLAEAKKAFEMVSKYADGVLKAVVLPSE
ncbi:MAG: NAD(P)-dependent alcohol dehydrogenase [Planctomycetes bacterium]|nr:NAD(P)-dependent alcohol dehydrogenase [Planctomycetota bacterium]